MALRKLSEQAKIRERDELIEHLYKFNLKIKPSVGIWYFAPGGGRFHDRYVPEETIEDRLERALKMARLGVAGIEAHYPNEVNEDNIYLYKKLEKECGIRLITIIPNLFWDADFEFGSLSNPLSGPRKKAIERLKQALLMNKKYGCEFCVVWPGIDGYTYPLGTNFYKMWELFEQGVADAMDKVPGVRVALEPKPYEPAPNNIYRNTSDGLLACSDIEARLKNAKNRKILEQGECLVGLNPEIGHIRMGFEEVAYALARVLRKGRLVHTHWNSQPLGNYDQDLDIGVVAPEQALAGLYVLKAYGYQEFFGIDLNPERLPVETAVEVSIEMLNLFNEKINRLPHEEIVNAYFYPDQNRGNLEKILLKLYR